MGTVLAYQRLTATSGSSGYQRLTGSGSPVGLGAPVAQPEQKSFLDSLLGNLAQGATFGVNIPALWKDEKQMATGLASLVGEGVHDFGRAAAKVIPGQQNLGVLADNPNDSYHLDDVGKGLVGFTDHGFHPTEAGITGDYWQRYSPLLPGGKPASDVYHQFREHPLSYLLDAVAAGGLAGKGASVAGSAALKGTDAAEVAAETTSKLVAEGVSAQTAKQAGVRAGLDALEAGGTELSGVQSIAQKILPSSTYKVVGDKLVLTSEIRNPVLRGAAAPIKRALSESLDSVAERAAAGESQIATLLQSGVEPTGKLVTDTKLLSDLVSNARDVGLTRIEKPILRDVLYPWKASAKVLAQMGADHLLARESAATPYREALSSAIKDDATVAENFHVTATGLDVNVADLPTTLDQTSAPAARMASADIGMNAPTSTAAEFSLGDIHQPSSVQYSTEPGALLSRTSEPSTLPNLVGQSETLDTITAPFHPQATTEDVLKEAPANAERLTATLTDAFGPDNIVPARVKSLNRANEKLAGKPYGPQQLRDAVGARVLVDDYAEMPGVLERLREISGGKFAAPLEMHSGETKVGYRGVDTVVRMPDGSSAEVQVLTRDAAAIASGESHNLYDALRRLAPTEENLPKITALKAQIEDLWAGEGQKMRHALDAGPSQELTSRPFVAGDLLPEELAMAVDAVPALAERTQNVVAKIDELTQRLTTDTPKLAASGWDVNAELDGARRLKRALNDGLRRQSMAARGQEVDRATLAADEIRLIDAEKYAETFPILAHTPREIVERAYFPMRFKNGAKFEGDALAGGPSIAALDDGMREAGKGQPIYFPYIDAERAKPADWFRSRSLKGANVFAKDPHTKQLKGVLLKEGTYITDPVEAYTRRASRAVREVETYNTFSTLTKTFGRKISNAEDVPSGWRIVAPDQMFLHHRTRMEFLDALDTLKSNGVDSDAALSQVLDRVMVRNGEDVTRALQGGQNLWAVPEHVAKQMERASQLAQVVGSTPVQLFWDTPMKAWRGLVLTASPRWVVNNVLGNTLFGAMQGVKVADVVRIASERFRALLAGWLETKGGARGAFGEFLGGGELRDNSLAAQLQQLPGASEVGSGFTGTMTQQYAPRLGERAAGTTTGKLITKASESPLMQRIHGWGAAVKHLNGEIESSYREASYLTAIEKAQGKSAITRTARSFWNAKTRMESIMEGGFNDASAKLALSEVNHFFGDYTRMTPFERHVVRRFIFPFWGFYRHQIKLLATFPFDEPLRAIVFKQAGQVHEEMMKQYGPLPEWLDGAVPLGPPGSEVSFFTTGGADPFNGTFQSPTSMLSPALKIFLEQSLGENLYSGQPFSDAGVTDGYGGQRFDAEGNPVSHVAPGIIEHLLQQLPQYTQLKQAVAGGKTYDTSTLLDALQGQAAIADSTTGAPKYPTGALEQLLKAVGMPTTTYDVAGYQQNLTEQQQSALRQLAQRQLVTG